MHLAGKNLISFHYKNYVFRSVIE